MWGWGGGIRVAGSGVRPAVLGCLKSCAAGTTAAALGGGVRGGSRTLSPRYGRVVDSRGLITLVGAWRPDTGTIDRLVGSRAFFS